MLLFTEKKDPRGSNIEISQVVHHSACTWALGEEKGYRRWAILLTDQILEKWVYLTTITLEQFIYKERRY